MVGTTAAIQLPCFSRGATALGRVGLCVRMCVAQLWQMILVKEVGLKVTPKQPSFSLHLKLVFFFYTSCLHP